jgi:hypothetical protein
MELAQNHVQCKVFGVIPAGVATIKVVYLKSGLPLNTE